LLKVYILNVKHGDSIVIQYTNDDKNYFGVIDSNISGTDEPPALLKLIELGAERLSFVALTHPHRDHYLGLPRILEYFNNKIDHLYTFPIGSYLPGRLKKLGKIYQKVHDSVDSPTLKMDTTEFVKFLVLAKRNIGMDKWEEPTGHYSPIAPTGFAGVELKVLLPLSKVKGYYFQLIEQESLEAVKPRDENALSLAMSVKYADCEIILGGDCSSESWMEHKIFCKRGAINVNGNIVKLPHHGSKHECSEATLKHVFTESKEGIACISANGISHPHSETLELLSNENISPYCTNFARICGNKLAVLDIDRDLIPTLRRYLISMRSRPNESIIQPCQGDIELSISKTGVNISTEFNHPCPRRGEYEKFFQATD
jgi:beta-lactamase superfamily II metal-dependent hydrolase